MPEVIVQVKIMCDKFLPKFYCVYLDMTTATYIPSPWRPHHHQADHKLVRVGPPIQDPPKLCLTPPTAPRLPAHMFIMLVVVMMLSRTHGLEVMRSPDYFG